MIFDLSKTIDMTEKNKSEVFVSVTGKGTISCKVKNYAFDPFFIKKAEEAKAEIDRVGLPTKKK
jgi:hypothetical protein